jgi:hypothetical protein
MISADQRLKYLSLRGKRNWTESCYQSMFPIKVLIQIYTSKVLVMKVFHVALNMPPRQHLPRLPRCKTLTVFKGGIMSELWRFVCIPESSHISLIHFLKQIHGEYGEATGFASLEANLTP